MRITDFYGSGPALSLIIQKHNNSFLLFPQINRQLSQMVKHEWFEIDFWQRKDAVTGSSTGRNVTWFVGHDNDEWVLRHYYRGGLMEDLLGDRFFYTGLNKTRSYQELKLLEQMYQQGLPVPKPVAGKVFKKGLFYTADIFIEKIPHAEDLVAKLAQSVLPEAGWMAIGAMIAKFHEAGVYHSDLNAHNILIDRDAQIWLIDFDKCHYRKVADKWQQANLDRLLRSFNKEKRLNQDFAFNEQCWKWLLNGYQSFYHLTRGSRH